MTWWSGPIDQAVNSGGTGAGPLYPRSCCPHHGRLPATGLLPARRQLLDASTGGDLPTLQGMGLIRSFVRSEGPGASGPHLNERQRRLLMAAEAWAGGLGHGAVRAAARAAGVSESTVRKVSVKDAGREVVAVDHLRGAPSLDPVRPRVQVRPNRSGSPHGSLTVSQKALSYSISRPHRSTISSLSVIAADH